VNRRKFLLLPLGAFPVAGYARYVEPSWLEVDRRRVALPGFLPGRKVRVVQLSDFHSSPVVPNSLIEQAVDLALAENPDLICLTGDFITEDRYYDSGWYTRVLRRLSERAPSFAIFGNHDGGFWTSSSKVGIYSTANIRAVLTSAGIPILDNSWTEITLRDQRVRLVGLGDLWARECKPEIAFRGVPADGIPTVLLAHNPDSKDVSANYRWDLMLSGHTHGGQVVCPVLDISPAPVRDKRYVKGLKPWNDRLVYVSAGVGSIGGVRFDCRPQVSLLELHA
jgi:predicted MPP superfamily phosphohydrolase